MEQGARFSVSQASIARRSARSRFAAGLGAALLVGCASFSLPPYSKLVHDTAYRTNLVGRSSVGARPLNSAAMLGGRSQAEIKQSLERLWRPTMRPSHWVNYNGLAA